jgi:translation initiation factor IF-2
MDFSDTLEKMLAAAKTAAGVHWKDIRGFLENEMAIAKEEAAAIALEVFRKTKTPEQAKIELQSVEESLQDTRLAVQVSLKAAAQDAINAALEVLRSAVNSAAGLAIF